MGWARTTSTHSAFPRKNVKQKSEGQDPPFKVAGNREMVPQWQMVSQRPSIKMNR